MSTNIVDPRLTLPSLDTCVPPKICAAPQTKYSVVLPVTPRQQWNIEGGFCGAMSVQTAHLAFGAWISQDLVRKANTHGVGHCEPGNGCELEPTNIGQTAQNLKLDYDVFDHSQPKPQAAAYKSWMKAHLVKGHPVVWYVQQSGHGLSKTCDVGVRVAWRGRIPINRAPCSR